MPEKPDKQEDRSAVAPDDRTGDRATVPQPATSTDRDAKSGATGKPEAKPEEEKRIERFRER